jgi:hypothetical protein
MERAQKTPIEGKLKWKKVGGGSFQMGNRIIKPGQVFDATVSEIPKAVRDLIIPMDGNMEVWKDEKEKTPEPADIVKPVYKLVPHGKSLFLFDIVDDAGKVLNEKSLKKEVAEDLMQKLNK